MTVTNTSASPNQYVTKLFDELGAITSVTDPSGAISYDYYSSGLPKSITAPDGSITTIEYDDYGNQTGLTEPNSGTYTYDYNSFGELISQDMNGEVTTVGYDDLGRIETITEPETVTTYVYDESDHGIGLPSRITTADGSSISYTYDELSRITSVTEGVDGYNFTESITYNDNGQRASLTYPSGFQIDYIYNSNHYLEQIKRADTDAMIWQANTMNARGQYEQFTYGNSKVTNQEFEHGFITAIRSTGLQNNEYDWDYATGNLLERSRPDDGMHEYFNYDNLNRLTSARAVTGSGSTTNSYTYGINGNITNSTELGRYIYGSDRPHAVTNIMEPVNLTDTDDQLVEYTSYNKIKRIMEGNNEVNISYGISKGRNKMVKSGDLNFTRYYSHGNYELDSSNSEIVKRHYIHGGSGIFAIFETLNSSIDNIEDMYYVHKDHLGSYEIITDNDGNVVEKNSYSAWGRKRNYDDWSYTGITASLFDRGYTGHEHLSEYGLINMNGRVYDPVVGRFLSVDMIVSDPENSQNYNRYSYVLNNPLKFTDPSGWDKICRGGHHGPYAEPCSQEINIPFDNLPQNISSTLVDPAGNIIDARNDGDHNIYIAYNEADILKYQSGNTDGLSLTGYTADPGAFVGFIGVNIFSSVGEYQWAQTGGGWIYTKNGLSVVGEPVTVTGTASSGGDWTGRAGNILTATGGTFGALKTTVTPGDSWLGNNGKYYSKNWGGNQYTGSRAGAFKAAGMYRMAGRANVAATVIVGGVAMYNGYQQDGGTYGQNFHRAGASTTGGLVGGFAGAKAGAAIGAGIGVWFGGVGAVPGAVIGGFIGGIAGSITGGYVGGAAVDYYYE